MKIKYSESVSPFLLLLLVALLAVSCQKASELDIPSYIAIDTISLDVAGLQGTASEKILDAWVYTDNDLEGAFELPAKFPVLKAGSSQLLIQPGIKMNGMAETRVPYPFYKPLSIPVTLNRKTVTSLGHLHTSYKTSTVFEWMEDFENPNLTLDNTARSSISYERYNDPSLAAAFPSEGNLFDARIRISSDSATFESTSHDYLALPKDGSEVFLELNYKSNCAFTVGLFIYGATTVQQSILVVNPSENWNKIYINFTPTVSLNNSATDFKVFITARKAEGGADADIRLDNIKLLHF